MPRAIRRITDEKPQEKLWDTYLFLESEPTALNILLRCYRRQGEIEAQSLAYQNTAPFIYYLHQARAYYRTAKQADLIVKPLLLYYGMTSLTKAYVLTLDPHYPAHTGLLRHGITTRKRKKRDYRFREDEVKIQKEGLVPHVLSLLHMTNGLEEKYVIGECLAQLPHLYDSYRQVTRQSLLHPVYVPNNTDEQFVLHETTMYVDEAVLDRFNLSRDGFVRMLNRYNNDDAGGTFELKNNRTSHRHFAVGWQHPEVKHVSMSGNGFENALFLQDAAGQHYLRLTTERRLHLPEFVLHLFLLFHLGMLARYETEHWGDIVLTFGSEERYLIHELLQHTERYFPNLILNEILDEQFMFTQP